MNKNLQLKLKGFRTWMTCWLSSGSCPRQLSWYCGCLFELKSSKWRIRHTVTCLQLFEIGDVYLAFRHVLRILLPPNQIIMICVKKQNIMNSFVISPASCFGTEARKMQTYCTYNNLFILSCTYHYFRIVSKYLALEVLALSTRQGWAHGRSSCSARRWCCGWCSRQIRC